MQEGIKPNIDLQDMPVREEKTSRKQPKEHKSRMRNVEGSAEASAGRTQQGSCRLDKRTKDSAVTLSVVTVQIFFFNERINNLGT